MNLQVQQQYLIQDLAGAKLVLREHEKYSSCEPGQLEMSILYLSIPTATLERA